MQTISGSLHPITAALLAYGKTIDPKALFPVMAPEAAELVVRNPYAFAMATVLDRGTKVDIIWTIPYDMRKALGHLDPWRIAILTESQLSEVLHSLPRRPRYISDAPRTIRELTLLVVREYGGDAARIWQGQRAIDVRRTFLSIYGVGPGIANMAVLLIEKAFDVQFDDLDRPDMDIKPDVHTQRVLYRLGVAEEQSDQAALAAARRLNPAYPGELDGALWLIGRRWCQASAPQCGQCPVSGPCRKRLE